MAKKKGPPGREKESPPIKRPRLSMEAEDNSFELTLMLGSRLTQFQDVLNRPMNDNERAELYVKHSIPPVVQRIVDAEYSYSWDHLDDDELIMPVADKYGRLVYYRESGELNSRASKVLYEIGEPNFILFFCNADPDQESEV